jgi:hypothetical protein
VPPRQLYENVFQNKYIDIIFTFVNL